MIVEDMRDLLLAGDAPEQLFKPIRTLPVVSLLFVCDVSASFPCTGFPI